MPDRYTLRPLDAARIDQAYPVVQSALPKTRLDQWRAYAAELVGSADAAATGTDAGPTVVPLRRGGAEAKLPDRANGIMLAQVGQGYIHGLFAYRVQTSLTHGLTLHVELFIALNLFDPTAVVEALMREMERLAERLDCAAIHLDLPHRPEEDQRSNMIDHGHSAEGIRLCKRIMATAAE